MNDELGRRDSRSNDTEDDRLGRFVVHCSGSSVQQKSPHHEDEGLRPYSDKKVPSTCGWKGLTSAYASHLPDLRCRIWHHSDLRFTICDLRFMDQRDPKS